MQNRITVSKIIDAIEIRRHIHKHPELSFQEKETSAYIKSVLRKWQIPFQLQLR